MPAASAASILGRFDRWDLRYLVLVLILCLMLGGVFQSLVVIYGAAFDTTVWLVFLGLLATFWVEMPVHRLLRPAGPLVIWVFLYICWGVMASPYSMFAPGYRYAIIFFSVTSAMAVVTSRPQRLRVFCNAAQWILVLNLAVTLLLINSPEYQRNPFFMKLNVDTQSDRFAGMWGNANVAGLVTLMALFVSRWASRLQAWIGVLCGLLIIYLTESRTATWILVTVAIIYLAFVASRRFRLNALVAVLVLGLGGIYALQTTGTDLGAWIASDQTLARVLDVTESKTTAEGGGSRVNVLKDWLGKVPAEPWYGYGLYTFNGGEAVEVPVQRPEFPIIGPHNLYLGIFLDVGIVGLLSFLGLIVYQLNVIRRSPLVPSTRNALFAFCLILLVFSNFNHNMLSDYSGWIGYALMFMLPYSPALASFRNGRDPAQTPDPADGLPGT